MLHLKAGFQYPISLQAVRWAVNNLFVFGSSCIRIYWQSKKKEFPHKFNSQFKFQLTHRSSPFILFSHTHLKITKNTHIYIYICAYIYFFPFAAVALKKQINKCILKYAAKAPFKMQNKYGEKNDRHQSKFY